MDTKIRNNLLLFAASIHEKSTLKTRDHLWLKDAHNERSSAHCNLHAILCVPTMLGARKLRVTDQSAEEMTLVRATINGDQSAFQRLMELYQRPIYNLAYRMLHNTHDAEDASQEIFLRAYTKLATYDQSRKFSTWIFSVASNYCIDRLRRRRPIVPLDDLAFALPSTEDGPERSALRGELRDTMQRVLAKLPDHYRLIAVLRYWNDLSYSEIEQVTGLSESAVKTRLHRARKMIEDALEAQGGLE